MAKQPDQFKAFEAEILSVKGECSAGHKAGDRLQLGCWDPGGLCGFFYHDIFPGLSLLQFGGNYPWNKGNEMTFECPDRANAVTMLVRKVE